MIIKRVLALTLLGLVLFGATFGARSAPKADDDFQLVKVADGVYAAIAAPGGLAGGNGGFIVGDGGVLVVDTFYTPKAAEELIGEITSRTAQPIKFVVNTHYHLDHTGGNQVFADRNIPIIAQENTRAWVSTKNSKFMASADDLKKRRDEAVKRLAELGNVDTKERRDLETRLERTNQLLALKLTPPTVTYATEAIHLYLGKREVVLFTRPGHTGGDTLVYVPDANVVFTGDIGWSRTLPNLIDATVNDWVPTLDKLVNQYSTAQFVPGHGAVATAADIADFRDYLADLRQRVQQAIKEGLTLQQAQDQLILPDKYKNFAFQNFVKSNISDVYKELTNTKTK